MTSRHERIHYPPRGLLGGLPGRAGVDMVNGEIIEAKSRSVLESGDQVVFETPGGGGLFAPSERDDDLIKQDIESGLTTAAAAREFYEYE
jgi:N-methylhydantoinase B